MKTDLFNIVTNSLRNYAIMQTDDRLLVPLTNIHCMYVYINTDRTKIKYIDLERIALGQSLSKSVYCDGCSHNVFTAEQIIEITDLIKELINSRQPEISRQFDNYFIGMA